MKNLKYLFLFVAVVSLSLSSCKKDDDPSFEEQLVGVWFATQVAYTNCDEPMYNETIAFPSNCDSENCIRFTFEDDGILGLYFKEDGDIEQSSGTYSGDEDAFTMCNDGDCVTGTMDIDGDTAIFSYEEDGCDATFTFKR